MFRKYIMFAAMLFVCLPIGAVTTSSHASNPSHAAITSDLCRTWMVDPGQLLVLCVAMLACSYIDRYHRRQMLMD